MIDIDKHKPLEDYVEVHENGCWIWKGAKDKDGYGVTRVNKKLIKAHRLVYYKTNEVSEDFNSKVVMHSCDNPSCVCPDHLNLSTQKDNIQDMYDKGRSYSRAGGANPSSKLSTLDVIEIRSLIGETLSSLAKRFGVSYSQIWRIKNNKSWINLGER